MTEIKVDPPFIKLEQFLKFGNIAETGGMAKLMIQDGIVEVNGEVCTMRGKKIYNNDIVSLNFEEGTEEYRCIIENI
ncbi:RNA-binding S4 domain-containing protein [Ruminococcus sp.]|uniref:RNA-binding S4 domain-containing protein n=1 Tax=Ruminococcus sp. TaxID=41978 RepID=UPI0025869372|nr:RNA-binding S4 domain-containing protein [Ruminococcus sp.]MCR5021319.1 RNA-binding S4 domain-containing protein [Ruminococcus sp.]